jgi:hypothetical protein
VLPEIDYGFFRLAVTIDTGPFGGFVQGSKEFVLRR